MKAPYPKEDISVLVVDDETSVRKVLSEVIGGAGYQVAAVGSGEEALQYFEQNELPHVVMTDIRMPGITGLELTKKIRQEISEEVQVIIITSHASVDTAIEAMRLGAYDYLTKPFQELEDVLLVLERTIEYIFLLQQNQFLSEERSRRNAELVQLNKQVNQINLSLSQLSLFAKEISQRLDPKEVIQLGVNTISQVLRDLPCVFFTYNALQGQVVAKAFANVKKKFHVRSAYPIKSVDNNEVVEEIKKISMSAHFLEHVHNSFQFSFPWIRPIVTKEMPVGILALDVNPPFSDLEERAIEQYIHHFAITMSNALHHERVEDLATKDWLTGLFNVRTFKERLEEEMQRCYRLRHPLSVLFFDIDNFKMYNDTHGHPAGDAVIRKMGQLIEQSFRVQDLSGRYGGEEFVVALPHTTFEQALVKADSFRRVIEEASFDNQQTQPLKTITISIGVATYPSQANTLEDILKLADDCLYVSKSQGRNKVTGAAAPKNHLPSFTTIPVAPRS